MGRKSIMCSTAQATLLVSCVHLLNGWPHLFFFFFDVQCTFRSLRECFGWGGGRACQGAAVTGPPTHAPRVARLVSLAAMLAVGVTLGILACALWANWWPLFVGTPPFNSARSGTTARRGTQPAQGEEALPLACFPRLGQPLSISLFSGVLPVRSSSAYLVRVVLF
jgi:hypothetical protein